jgi:hypothetical protein
MPAIIGGSIAAGGSLLGGMFGSKGASKAAGQQAQASEMASQIQAQQFQQTQAGLAPYNQAGQNVGVPGMALEAGGGTPWDTYGPQLAAATQSNWALPYYQQAGNMLPPSVVNEAWLQQTPGYQFQLGQGLQATQSAAAARGLGVSGASLKGAATYATGLADQNYQNQYNNAQTAYQDMLNLGTNVGGAQQNVISNIINENTAAQGNLQNAFSRYQNIGSLGESAAAMTGQQGTQAAANQGNYLSQAGQAQAAGTIGSNNALQSGLQNALGSLTSPASASNYQNSALGQMISGMFGNSTTSGYTGPSSSSLLGGAGDPTTLQNQLGLSPNQYV